MLSSKTYYSFDVQQWLAEHGDDWLQRTERRDMRNRAWFHMANDQVISVPDKWEYPWYAA